MKERPILMNGAMARATLDDSKTQTRRIVKLPHQNPLGRWESTMIGGPDGGRLANGATIPLQGGIWHTRTGESFVCPHGQPGDRLWVRETWRTTSGLDGKPPRDFAGWPVKYEADGAVVSHGSHFGDTGGKTRTSIHMPRWASRILLEITDVRVERLNDCSGPDATAEGVRPDDVRQFDVFGMGAAERSEVRRRAAVAPYERLWDSINGAGAWAINPWVWAITFKRVMP